MGINSISEMVRSGAACGLEMTKICFTTNVLVLVQRTIRNKSMWSRAIVKMRLRAVLHTDVMELNVSSVDGVRYFVTFIDKACGHVSMFHMKMKTDAA